jgi:tripartite ATP-independent transporter DctM subunit
MTDLGSPSRAVPAALAVAIRAENILASLAFAGIMVLPLAQIFSRWLFEEAIPGAGPISNNLTLWVGMLGAAIAAREGKLLTLATGEFMPKGRLGDAARVVAAFVGAAMATIFAAGGQALVRSERAAGDQIALGIPVWIADLAFPFAFGLIALRIVLHASPSLALRAIAATGILAGLVIGQWPALLEGQTLWPFMVVLVAGGVFGTPIFALLGGIAMFAFLVDGLAPIVLLVKAHEELTSAAGLAAIPLFTLAGFLFAEGRSSERILRALRALFGWAPGGTAVAAATLCACFTLFTGGSGVTILAIGGLLLPGLLKEGYRERFSMGLLTASGSLGLLFPLSLPLMLYGIVAQGIALEDLFIGGFLPGLLMLGLVATLGVREGVRAGARRVRFSAREAGAAVWGAKWEILLPIFVLGVILGGYAVPLECAPMAALYAVIVQRFINRDLPTWRDVVRVMSDCIALVGGVLLILSVAVGLTNYLVTAQVPEQILDWTQSNVESKWLFLLCLNIFLLLVGTVMDIFSAIIVVVPLIVPLADVFEINRIHLGIIFIANLELGYLHPPLGLNLLLASVRFKKPVLEVMWATLPMLGILALGVLLITYWEWLTLGILAWLGRG